MELGPHAKHRASPKIPVGMSSLISVESGPWVRRLAENVLDRIFCACQGGDDGRDMDPLLDEGGPLPVDARL